MQVWLSAIVVVSAIAISVDASKLGARRGALGGGLVDMGPAGWFFATLLLWIAALPCYLAVRPKLVRRAHVLATHPQFARSAPVSANAMPMPTGAYGRPSSPGLAAHDPSFTAQPYVPPPGWYPSPGGHGMCWWDGVRWIGGS